MASDKKEKIPVMYTDSDKLCPDCGSKLQRGKSSKGATVYKCSHCKFSGWGRSDGNIQAGPGPAKGTQGQPAAKKENHEENQQQPDPKNQSGAGAGKGGKPRVKFWDRPIF